MNHKFVAPEDRSGVTKVIFLISVSLFLGS